MRWASDNRAAGHVLTGVEAIPLAGTDAFVAEEAPAIPSFRCVFETHAPFVWRVLRHLGVGEADLPDAAQEVFLAVHRKLADFEGRSSLRTWLWGIASHVASHHRTRAHRVHETPTDRPPDTIVAPTQHEDLERSRMRVALRTILAELDEAKRTVFVLHDVEGLPMSEIALAMGCPLQTAYSRLHAARKIALERLGGVREVAS